MKNSIFFSLHLNIEKKNVILGVENKMEKILIVFTRSQFQNGLWCGLR